jgi:hypothetical protein
MEPESSLPCSQQLVAGSYPDQAHTTPSYLS